MQGSPPPAPLEDVKLQKIEVAGNLEHIEDQLRATEETNAIYNSRIQALEDELSQLNKKSKKAFKYLNSQLEKHQEKGVVLQEVYNKYPDIQFMDQQIKVIEEYCKNSQQFQDRVVDPEFLREMGIKKNTQNPQEKLIKSVDYLIKLYQARYKGVFSFKLMPYNNHTGEELDIINLITALESSIKNSAKKYLIETESLKQEIQELRDEIEKLSRDDF
ncbi:hypothetical protein TVAG_136470 [Trichomonas vaginalis G3]|uniref:Uncharacterized protein n=1 Tax=Trichomonas vaginalis (strain ATCC PRA-98 / G3) TaxID=412133 RepID=A2DJC9_TRIV3|nr:hypothetical protein TVAGG3_0543470 [Trichomonas vaginalis G3]EAY19516.1 hypothetical protein TVAG_136470 [Trichomonas vaginalis G3]KAI5520002.1 hypothetical protein TVAGG3_0543470 [Trichomonas vaginalis G3]|eukprot:XP_001580502.1 hypothetical protein [Trichomonas vaginalis G3]